MSAERAVLQAIREEIDKLTVDRKATVEEIAAKFRTELNAGGSLAVIALALVGAEQAAQGELS